MDIPDSSWTVAIIFSVGIGVLTLAGRKLYLRQEPEARPELNELLEIENNVEMSSIPSLPQPESNTHENTFQCEQTFLHALLRDESVQLTTPKGSDQAFLDTFYKPDFRLLTEPQFSSQGNKTFSRT
eukprot:TRINITY_DN1706_c0_g1_i1.p1 TRINITY_DN1706_c0_g1~~TRINITY_DN1706_c0_g1_i1.p1  ORF type:complete len:127 (-),score=25.70 TRINITY_DN1706_c0_g1_i1:977-1357(-)